MKNYHKTSKKFRSAGEETHGKGRHFVHKVGDRISFKTPKGRTTGKVTKVSKEFYMVSNKDKLYKVNRNSILYSMGYVDAINRVPAPSPPLVLKKINIFPSSTTISGTTRLVTPIKVGIVTDIDIPIAGPTTKPSTSTPVTEQGSNTSSSTTRTTKSQTTTKTSTTTKKTPVIMKDPEGRGRRGEKVFQRTLDRLQLRNPKLIIPKSIRDKPIGPILNDVKFVPRGTKLINKTKT